MSRLPVNFKGLSFLVPVVALEQMGMVLFTVEGTFCYRKCQALRLYHIRNGSAGEVVGG